MQRYILTAIVVAAIELLLPDHGLSAPAETTQSVRPEAAALAVKNPVAPDCGCFRQPTSSINTTRQAVPTVILTPCPPPTPRITGPKVFGVRPGNPFLFRVSATGIRPMTFSAVNLPTGLVLDSSSGLITGTLTQTGETEVALTASNSFGQFSRRLRLVCGQTIGLTPPLGWNSWYCFAQKVDDAKVRAAADIMVSSGLADHGWSYINIDDCWEGQRDASGMIQGNEKFPVMKALGDYIHSKGLKFGIYSSPGLKTCGGFEGSYQHEDQDAQQYGNWGVDFLKYDWCSYSRIAEEIKTSRYAALLPPADAEKLRLISSERIPLYAIWYKLRTPAQTNRLAELNKDWNVLCAKIRSADRARIDLEAYQEPYARFRKSLDQVKRDIFFSYCQYGMLKVWEWGAKLGGNSWRTKSDLGAAWRDSEQRGIADIGFAQNGLEKFAGPGHWNDPDLLRIGNAKLTPDEEYSYMSLWSLISAPLLISCDMTKMSPFTMSLFSNDEVLDINQDPLGKPAGCVSKIGDVQVWARDLEDGSKAAGLFNLGEKTQVVSVAWPDLNIKGPQTIRDLWRQQNLETCDGKFEATVPAHGVVLVRIFPVINPTQKQ